MKKCIDCEYVYPKSGPRVHDSSSLRCSFGAPKFIDLVTGKDEMDQYPYCQKCREDGGQCGAEEAFNFVKRKSRLNKFLRRFNRNS